MKPVLVNGYKFEYIINAKVLISGENLAVPMDVPVEETSRSVPKVSRMRSRGLNLSL